MRLVVALILSIPTLTSCATAKISPKVELVEGASDVKIYRRDDPPSACKELDSIVAVDGTNSEMPCSIGTKKNAEAALRNEVVSIGGNALLLGESTPPPHIDPSGVCMIDSDLRYQIEGIAFYCPPGAKE